MKNLKYIALGILVGYLTPYILELLNNQKTDSHSAHRTPYQI